MLVAILFSVANPVCCQQEAYGGDGSPLPDSVRQLSVRQQLGWLLEEAESIQYSDNLLRLKYLKTGEALASENNESGYLVQIKDALSYTLIANGLYEEGLKTAYEGVRLAKEQQDSFILNNLQRWMIGAFNELGEHKKAVATAAEVVRLALDAGDSLAYGNALISQGEAYRYAGKFDSARMVYLRAYQVFQRHSTDPEDDFALVIYNNLAYTEYGLNRPDSAQAYLDRLYPDPLLTDPYLITEANFCQVLVYAANGEGKSARKLALEGVERSRKNSFFQFEARYAQWLADYHRENGELEKAYLYLERYYSIQEVLQSQRAKTQIALQDSKNEREELRSRAEVLETEKQTQIYIILGLGALLLSILVFLWQIFRKNRAMRELNRQLQEKNTSLDDAYREINGLISVVAHDLRSPITKVQSLVNLIQHSGEHSPDTTQYLKVMDQVLEGGSNLIRDVLTLSSVEHDKEITLAAIDVAGLARISVEAFSETAIQKQIRIQQDLPESLELKTEISYFERILDNLLSNAIKFSPEGKAVFVTLKENLNTVQLSIRDEGPGISKADQQKMFKKFQKLSARPTAGESSTGLGLSIIKALVDKLEGEIRVNSILGVGTEFVVVFPK